MALIPPFNDKQCLTLLHEEALRYAQLASVRQFAGQFRTPAEVIRYIRRLEQRDDFGDPDDGPRLACEISQRLRFAPSDPNCFERTVLYLALAEILAPQRIRSSASLVMDQGWHTFPVELRNGLPEVVVLDPVTPPRNAMLATAYQARKLTPSASKHLAPWFASMARNACFEDGGEDRYHRAIRSLRNAMLTGDPIEELDDLVYVLERAEAEAELWGGHGRAAFDQMQRSIRNFSFSLDRKKVSRFVNNLLATGQDMAPMAIRAALIAEFGPAGALMFEGVQLAINQAKEANKEQAETKPEPKPKPAPDKAPSAEAKKPAETKQAVVAAPKQTAPEASSSDTSPKDSAESANGKPSPNEQMRRMSLAFRPAH